MKLSVFGVDVEVVRRNGEWLAFYPGSEGKKRHAEDILIPAEISEEELLQYIGDLCHEWATPEQSEVVLIPASEEI